MTMFLAIVFQAPSCLSATESSDWFYNPFNKNSAHHRSIGSGAEYAASDHPATLDFLQGKALNINVGYKPWGCGIWEWKPDDPLFEITYESPNHNGSTSEFPVTCRLPLPQATPPPPPSTTSRPYNALPSWRGSPSPRPAWASSTPWLCPSRRALACPTAWPTPYCSPTAWPSTSWPPLPPMQTSPPSWTSMHTMAQARWARIARWSVLTAWPTWLVRPAGCVRWGSRMRRFPRWHRMLRGVFTLPSTHGPLPWLTLWVSMRVPGNCIPRAGAQPGATSGRMA